MMSLRVKALAFIGVTFASLLAVLAFAADRVVFSSFRHLEVLKVREQIDLEVREFERGIDGLAQTCLDYSGWDQAWEAVGALNPLPLKEELADATMQNLRLRGACIINRSGGVFLDKGFDPERGTETSFPSLPTSFLATTGPLLGSALAGSGTHGLLSVGSEPFVFAAQPILPTDRKGTPRGVFIMLRAVDLRGRSTPERHVDGRFRGQRIRTDPETPFLKASGLEALPAELSGSPVPVDALGMSMLLASKVPSGNDWRFDVRLHGESAIEGLYLMDDLEGKTRFALRVLITRPIHHLGLATRRTLWIALLVSGFAFGALCLRLLRTYVLGRIETFTVTLGRLAEDPHLELTLDERGDDEVARLAGVFNRMRSSRDNYRRALEVANAELDSFNSSVSHDLRAPARHLSGFADILLEDHGKSFTPEVHDLVVRMRDGAKRLGDVVDALLRLSRFGREEPQMTVFNLSEMVGKIAAELLEQFPTPTTEMVIAPGLEVMGDPAWIRHLLENLLSNAVKFTRKTPSPRMVMQPFFCKFPLRV